MNPRNPLTATEHRARWAAAVFHVWEWSYALMAEQLLADRPQMHPENVFDFHDGLRLLVSSDKYGERPVMLHVSASGYPGSKMGRLWIPDNLAKLDAIVRERVVFIGGPATLTLAYTTMKGVLHFYDPPLPKELLPWQTKPASSTPPATSSSSGPTSRKSPPAES